MKAIIFDFDGVIADTESQKFRDISKSAEECGFELDKSDFKEFIGKQRGYFLHKNKKEVLLYMHRNLLDFWHPENL